LLPSLYNFLYFVIFVIRLTLQNGTCQRVEVNCITFKQENNFNEIVTEVWTEQSIIPELTIEAPEPSS
jgi:hypothetical protein